MKKHDIEEYLFIKLGENEEWFDPFFKKLKTHVRHRKLKKIDKTNDSEVNWDEIHESTHPWLFDWGVYRSEGCPVCGSKLIQDSYTEEYHGVVETHQKCESGCYERSWSYGKEDFSLHGKIIYTCHPHLMNPREYFQVMNLIESRLKHEKGKSKLRTILGYKKKKSQRKRR